MAIRNYILSYHQADRIIHELTDGDIAYVAYMDRSYSVEDQYYVKALDISDLTDPWTIWFLNVPGCIDDMIQDGALRYISTTAIGLVFSKDLVKSCITFIDQHPNIV